jgi:hypothetical protein
MFVLKIFKKSDFWFSLLFAVSAVAFSFWMIPYSFSDTLDRFIVASLIFGYCMGDLFCEIKHLIMQEIKEEKERIRAIEQV